MDITNFTEGYLQMLKSFVRTSPVRRKIIFILMHKDNLTKTELREELKKREDVYNYRTIWEHIETLEGLGIVKTVKSEHEKGKPVRVILTPVVFRNQSRITKSLLENYPHTKISEEEKKRYL